MAHADSFRMNIAIASMHKLTARILDVSNGLEGGVSVRDLPGPAQSILRLGQVQVPGDLGGRRRWPPIQADPPDILEAPHDGGEGGGLLLDIIPGSVRGGVGRSALPHHL